MQGLSPDKQRDLILSVGTHRGKRPLSPVEVAEAIETALSAGTGGQELAVALHFDITMLARFRRLLKLAPSIRHLVDWGGRSYLSFASASEIARLDANGDQESLSEGVIKHELSKEEVRQIVQIHQRSAKAINECIAEILRMRPQVVRRHLLIGAILSEKLRSSLRRTPQRERDQLLTKALSSRVANLPGCQARLGVERFALIGDESLSTIVQGLPGGFEKAVNEYLEAEVSQQ